MENASAARGVVTSLAVGLLTLTGTPAAVAVKWYSEKRPLYAHQDSDPRNSTLLAAGHGNFYIHQHSDVRSAVHYLDMQPGGHSVYGETKFSVYSQSMSCGSDERGVAYTCWHETASDQTGRDKSGNWIGPWTSIEPLPGDSSQMRGRIHVCEDQPHAPDDCSAWVTITRSY